VSLGTAVGVFLTLLPFRYFSGAFPGVVAALAYALCILFTAMLLTLAYKTLYRLFGFSAAPPSSVAYVHPAVHCRTSISQACV